MSGLSNYMNAPLVSGGTEVSKGTNVSPVQFVLESGMTSNSVPLWLCTPLPDFYFESITVDPVDIDGTDESAWVTLKNALPTGEEGAAALPGEPIALPTAGPGDAVYHKYFVQVTIPSGTANQIKVDVKLQVAATKRPVTT